MQIKGTTCFPFGSAGLCFHHLSHLAKRSDLAGKGSVGRKALMASATFPGLTAPQFNTGEFKTQRSQEWSQSIKDKLYLLEITAQGEGNGKEFHSPFSNCCYACYAFPSGYNAGWESAALECNLVCEIIFPTSRSLFGLINIPCVTLLSPFLGP